MGTRKDENSDIDEDVCVTKIIDVKFAIPEQLL
jgi:hypothetical protein